MPVGRGPPKPLISSATATAPSQVSIGKKPMAYPQGQPQTQTPQGAGGKRAGKGRAAPSANPSANAGTNASTNAKGKGKSTNPSTSTSSGNSKIWSTSTTEERERIKEFWLGLGEDERRNLVKIEKDTVLRKMKDQQKHSCGCAVCGRKRNAIEEELQVLYDAYYEELEQYANYQQRYVSSGGTIPPPPGPGPFPGSVEVDGEGRVRVGGHQQGMRAGAIRGGQQQRPLPNAKTKHPSQQVNGRKPLASQPQLQPDDGLYEDPDPDGDPDEDEDEEEDEEDEADDPEDDVDVPPPHVHAHPPPAAHAHPRAPVSNPARAAPQSMQSKLPSDGGLFNLGSSLTVTGRCRARLIMDPVINPLPQAQATS